MTTTARRTLTTSGVPGTFGSAAGGDDELAHVRIGVGVKQRTDHPRQPVGAVAGHGVFQVEDGAHLVFLQFQKRLRPDRETKLRLQHPIERLVKSVWRFHEQQDRIVGGEVLDIDNVGFLETITHVVIDAVDNLDRDDGDAFHHVVIDVFQIGDVQVAHQRR